MKELFLEYLQLLMACFKYDVEVYSNNMWMYYLACIPAFFYTMFFMAKWAVLTAPFWLPVSMITKGGFPIKFYWNKQK